MPDLKTYDLFISHAWKYGSEYDRLINLLDNAPFFYYRNYSAPKDKPLISPSSSVRDQTILNKIKDKIKYVNCVLVISGMYAQYSDWIQAEIDISKEYSKPMIGITPYGGQRIPTNVLIATKEDVGWNTQSIVNAIRKHSI
jgi:hypothetical protein